MLFYPSSSIFSDNGVIASLSNSWIGRVIPTSETSDISRRVGDHRGCDRLVCFGSSPSGTGWMMLHLLNANDA